MAKQAPSYEMPLDQPIAIAPGVTHRESDWQGSAKYGFVNSQGDTPEGVLKGDLGWASLPAPRPLQGPVPFVNLRNRK